MSNDALDELKYKIDTEIKEFFGELAHTTAIFLKNNNSTENVEELGLGYLWTAAVRVKLMMYDIYNRLRFLNLSNLYNGVLEHNRDISDKRILELEKMLKKNSDLV